MTVSLAYASITALVYIIYNLGTPDGYGNDYLIVDPNAISPNTTFLNSTEKLFGSEYIIAELDSSGNVNSVSLPSGITTTSLYVYTTISSVPGDVQYSLSSNSAGSYVGAVNVTDVIGLVFLNATFFQAGPSQYSVKPKLGNQQILIQ
jgi:hypothetical protein